jgi:hypothetical protein
LRLCNWLVTSFFPMDMTPIRHYFQLIYKAIFRVFKLLNSPSPSTTSTCVAMAASSKVKDVHYFWPLECFLASILESTFSILSSILRTLLSKMLLIYDQLLNVLCFSDQQNWTDLIFMFIPKGWRQRTTHSDVIGWRMPRGVVVGLAIILLIGWRWLANYRSEVIG